MSIQKQTHICPTCASRNQQSILIEQEKSLDAEGFLCHSWLCPACGYGTNPKAVTRAVDEQPACKRCGHMEQRFVKGGVDNPFQPGGGAVKDGKTFLDMMRGQSIPGGGM